METVKTSKFAGYYKSAVNYLRAYPGERSQLTYALNKLTTKYRKAAEEIDESIQQNRQESDVKFCLKDKETGAFLEKETIISGQVIYRKQFDIAGEKARNEAVNKFLDDLNDTDFEFEAHIVSIPAGLDIGWVEAFSGFVFSEQSESEKLDWYLAQKQE